MNAAFKRARSSLKRAWNQKEICPSNIWGPASSVNCSKHSHFAKQNKTKIYPSKDTTTYGATKSCLSNALVPTYTSVVDTAEA